MSDLDFLLYVLQMELKITPDKIVISLNKLNLGFGVNEVLFLPAMTKHSEFTTTLSYVTDSLCQPTNGGSRGMSIVFEVGVLYAHF